MENVKCIVNEKYEFENGGMSSSLGFLDFAYYKESEPRIMMVFFIK